MAEHLLHARSIGLAPRGAGASRYASGMRTAVLVLFAVLAAAPSLADEPAEKERGRTTWRTSS